MVMAAPVARIVSLNICTDDWLLRLADPGQIAAITSLSQDPQGGLMAAQARRHTAIQGQAEEALALKPDLILAGPFTTPATVGLLRRLKAPLLVVPLPETFAQAKEGLRRFAAAIGQPARGEQAIAAMEAQLQQPATPLPRKLRALMLQANGFTAGKGTFVDEILQAADLVNIAAEQGIAGYGRMPLEDVLRARPDLLIIDGEADDAPALAARIPNHPALKQLAMQRVMLPSRLWTCPGPGAVEAVLRLRNASAAARAPE